MPRIITVFMDQISDHQRDLTNSASGRTYGEIIAYAVELAKRLSRTMKKLKVDRKNLERNFMIQGDLIIAEPLQLILSSLGHPDAHEKVRKLTLRAQAEEKNLLELTRQDPELKPYFKGMTANQLTILSSPSRYTGIAENKAIKVAENWKTQFGF